jgi:hypothetical protein
MKPFRSAEEMLDAHELMFGPAGRQCAEVVLKWAATLFAVPLDVLNIRVVLAPVELGPYNRHAGYIYGGEGKGAFILGNRHLVHFSDGVLVPGPEPKDVERRARRHQLRHGDIEPVTPQQIIRSEDFIVHELTHARQGMLLREHQGDKDWAITRPGVHRDRGWYTAISEACPKYLGFELPPSLWPTGPRTREGALTEVEMTHWPHSLRALAEAGDPRIPKTAAAA